MSTENEKRGHAFERWVLSRLREPYFRHREWRPPYGFTNENVDWPFTPGIVVQRGNDEYGWGPDLLVEIPRSRGSHCLLVALECKWRRWYTPDVFKEAVTSLAEATGWYQDRTGIRVHAVFGEGGTAADPASVFVIPWNELAPSLADKKQGWQLGSYRLPVHWQGLFYVEEEQRFRTCAVPPPTRSDSRALWWEREGRREWMEIIGSSDASSSAEWGLPQIDRWT